MRQKASLLEMANSKMKLGDAREREKHDEEIDEMRSGFKRKVGISPVKGVVDCGSTRQIIALEQQLEEAQTEKTRLQKQIRELGEQIRQQPPDFPSVEYINFGCRHSRRFTRCFRRDGRKYAKLKRHFRRTKAMLTDAQILVEHYQKAVPSKTAVKQLQNQVACSHV